MGTFLPLVHLSTITMAALYPKHGQTQAVLGTNGSQPPCPIGPLGTLASTITGVLISWFLTTTRLGAFNVSIHCCLVGMHVK